MRLIFLGKNSARMETFMRMKLQDGRERGNQLLAHIKKKKKKVTPDISLSFCCTLELGFNIKPREDYFVLKLFGVEFQGYALRLNPKQ